MFIAAFGALKIVFLLLHEKKADSFHKFSFASAPNRFITGKCVCIFMWLYFSKGKQPYACFPQFSIDGNLINRASEYYTHLGHIISAVP